MVSYAPSHQVNRARWVVITYTPQMQCYLFIHALPPASDTTVSGNYNM